MTAEEKVRKYFDDNFLYQKPYAEKAGIAISRFNRILNGKTKMTADELGDLSEALGISAGELLHYGEQNESEG